MQIDFYKQQEELKKEEEKAKKLVESILKENKSFKNDLCKPMMNLLPFESLEAVAMVLNHGAKTYGENTWQKVENAKERYEAALLRHLTAYKKGEKTDKESGLNHMAHLACNALFMLWFEIQENKGSENAK